MAKFGSLRKLHSGRWQARYTDHNNGRMISAPDTFRTKSDASAWLAARRADIDRGLIANDVAARLPLAAYWDDYLPSIEVRLQEMFGTTRHPVVGAHRLPLRITLLSPAQRPLQTTLDLPGFWTSSYSDVRKDMRGAYPRHPWPEDPTAAEPTLRAKPRGT